MLAIRQQGSDAVPQHHRRTSRQTSSPSMSQRVQHSAPGQRQAADNNRVTLGCVNAWSVGNKVPHHYRWASRHPRHQREVAWVFRFDGVTPPGYNCIDAVQPTPPDVRREFVTASSSRTMAAWRQRAVSGSPAVLCRNMSPDSLCLTLVWQHSAWLINSSYSACQHIQCIKGVDDVLYKFMIDIDIDIGQVSQKRTLVDSWSRFLQATSFTLLFLSHSYQCQIIEGYSEHWQ